MKTMKIESSIEQAYIAEIERAKEIYELILDKKGDEAAEEALKQMLIRINQKYGFGQ